MHRHSVIVGRGYLKKKQFNSSRGSSRHCGLDWPNIRPNSQRPMWIKDFWEHLLLIFWKYQPGKKSFIIPTITNNFLVFSMLNNFSSWRCLFQHLRWLLTNAYWVKHPAPSRCPIISTTAPATSLQLTLLAIYAFNVIYLSTHNFSEMLF